jgi:hypothetical protein
MQRPQPGSRRGALGVRWTAAVDWAGSAAMALIGVREQQGGELGR